MALREVLVLVEVTTLARAGLAHVAHGQTRATKTPKLSHVSLHQAGSAWQQVQFCPVQIRCQRAVLARFLNLFLESESVLE